MSLLTGLQTVYFISQGPVPPPALPVMKLDCSLSEKHSRESPATEFEVENGQTITDHITIKPLKLHIQGIITDSPLGLGLSTLIGGAASFIGKQGVPLLGNAAGALALTAAFDLLPKKSVLAYKQLLAMQATRLPLTVHTSLYTYFNMFIHSISVPRDAKTGRMLIFDMDLTQLLLVVPQVLPIVQFAVPDVAAGLASKGVAPPNEFVTAAQASKTAAQAPLDGIAAKIAPVH